MKSIFDEDKESEIERRRERTRLPRLGHFSVTKEEATARNSIISCAEQVSKPQKQIRASSTISYRPGISVEATSTSLFCCVHSLPKARLYCGCKMVVNGKFRNSSMNIFFHQYTAHVQWSDYDFVEGKQRCFQ